MGGFIVLLIIIVGIAIFVNIIIAAKFEEIALKKGYDRSINSFKICFWLGVIGYIYVIALPDLKLRESIEELLKVQKEQ